MVEPEQPVILEPVADERPWDRPGAVRRDCAPQRGGLLALPGFVGFLCAFGSVLVVPGLVALLLAALTWRLAGPDLAGMRAGRMDPAGQKQAETALALASTALVTVAVCWAVLAFIGLLCLVDALSRGVR